ncbi:NO-inducible flavohemoprotein [Sphingomonas baiyangensis]|uniref:Flavohemoprotein n=1 Tax=Sphingomonas baiyangensis TaxID=2572576 RepID=A0A4U1L3P3_9SPHN|nr:NO-inducible flavohemoprotein [Sphingomonas baiyangensis]TKD51521.1 NO-inducible flavohemoprotein [Sphingomonas baiyangensis]
MSRTLSEQTIAIVKATVPALEAHGLDITRAMYARLFQDPAIRDLFNQSHHGETGSQPKALAAAVLAYAQNIENLGVLAEAVERIAQKHVGLQILPEHYPAVATALLAAIKDVLGDAATNEILEAWGEAYWFLADILIGREAQLYETLTDQPGGWRGWRDFAVVEKHQESEIITSFVLRPVDGGAVVRHKPGQYLTLWLDIPGEHPLKRNYSISAAPNGETYRISVKREPQGIASGWLHDHVEVGATLKVSVPAGEFFLADAAERPIVLLSGGVGLTPMVSMLESLVREGASVPIHYVHGTLNGSTHAMRDYVRALAEQSSDVRVTTFYQQPRTEDVQGRDYDQEGLITGDWLRANTSFAAANYYLCGPKPFLRAFVGELTLAGVPRDRIHFEFFGPADELMAA